MRLQRVKKLPLKSTHLKLHEIAIQGNTIKRKQLSKSTAHHQSSQPLGFLSFLSSSGLASIQLEG